MYFRMTASLVDRRLAQGQQLDPQRRIKETETMMQVFRDRQRPGCEYGQIDKDPRFWFQETPALEGWESWSKASVVNA